MFQAPKSAHPMPQAGSLQGHGGQRLCTQEGSFLQGWGLCAPSDTRLASGFRSVFKPQKLGLQMLLNLGFSIRIMKECLYVGSFLLALIPNQLSQNTAQCMLSSPGMFTSRHTSQAFKPTASEMSREEAPSRHSTEDRGPACAGGF